MQIVFIENENPLLDSSGGIFTYLAALAEELHKDGHQTILLGIGKKKHLAKQKYFTQVVSVVPLTECNNLIYNFFLLLKAPFLKFPAGALLHAQRPDRVLPFIFSRHKILVTLHGRQDLSIIGRKGKIVAWLYKMAEKLVSSKVERYLAVNEDTAAYQRKVHPALKNKLTVIPCGIDLSIFKPQEKFPLREERKIPQNAKVMTFVGRFGIEKNVPFLIDVFFRVKELLPETYLVLGGFGEDEQKIKEKIRNRQGIIFLGRLNHDEVVKVLNLSDCFCLASSFEGSPIVLREALACGVPAISTDVGDAKDVLRSCPGCAIAPLEVEAYARKVVETLRNLPYPEAVREKITPYSFTAIAKRTIAVYKEIAHA